MLAAGAEAGGTGDTSKTRLRRVMGLVMIPYAHGVGPCARPSEEPKAVYLDWATLLPQHKCRNFPHRGQGEGKSGGSSRGEVAVGHTGCLSSLCRHRPPSVLQGSQDVQDTLARKTSPPLLNANVLLNA